MHQFNVSHSKPIAVLEALFTGVNADDISRSRGLMDIVGGSTSLLDTDPLAALIENSVDKRSPFA